MVLSHSLPMENSNNWRRHKRLRDFVAFMLLGGLVTGCEAKVKNEPTKATPPEVTKLTVDGCAAIAVQAEMIACFEKLKVQQEAEIAAKRKTLETEQEANNVRRTRVDVLSKEAEESMKRLEERVLAPER